MQQNKKNILKLKKNEEKFGREKESFYYEIKHNSK